MKTSPRARKRGGWSPEDVVQLLIDLDEFTRSQRGHGKVLQKKLILHVRQSKRFERRTAAQIEGKLRNIYRQWSGGPSCRGLESLLDRGIEALRRLPLDIRREIEDGRKARELQSPRHLRSNGLFPDRCQNPRDRPQPPSSVPATPTRAVRTLRSQSRTPVTPTPSGSESRILQALHHPPVGAEDETLYISRAKRSTPLTESLSDVEINSTKAKSQESQHNSRPTRSAPSTESLSDIETHSTNAKSQKSRESQDEHKSDGPQMKADRARYPFGVNSDISVISYDNPELTSRLYDISICSGNRDLYRDLLSDNVYFRRDCEKLELENRKLNTKIRILGGEDPQRRIDQTLQHYTILTQQLRVKNAFGPRNANGIPLSYPIIGKIRSLFDRMKSRCAVASQRTQYRYPNSWPSAESVDMEDLMNAAVHSNKQRTPLSVTMTQLQSRISPSQMIHCLIGISIQEWVFKPPMRCIMMLSSPLLDRYQTLLRTLCGKSFLQTIDYEAHQSLIATPSFKHVYLKEAAKQLAGRLFDVIHPFIAATDYSSTAEVCQRLQVAFEMALEIKAQTLCCTHVFDTIWPSPNSRVPRSLAVSESEASFEGSGSILINVTLIPGIQRYSRDEDVVDYSSFSLEGKGELGESETICEAVVVPLRQS